jgi:WD40 repeat protein
MHQRIALLGSIVLALTGCSTAHVEPGPVTPFVPAAAHDVASQIATTLSPHGDLEHCLAGGGALVELGAVNNDDQADHGALLTFGVSPEGLVAAAGADGTLKFWTMSAALVGTADPSTLTYGTEVGGSPITDLAFDGDGAIASDVRGLVSRMTPTGLVSPMGGTMPDMPIDAVAVDAATHRLAHAQHGPVAPLVVRGATATDEITETLDAIADLAFTVDGELLVAGARAGRAALEIRGASDVTRVVASPALGLDGPVREIASASLAPVHAAVSIVGVAMLSGHDVVAHAGFEHALRSVALTPTGAYALVLSEDGMVHVLDTTDGHELTTARVVQAPTATAVGVRVDATGSRFVVGVDDAMIHVLACR